jgi:hypothetical protein
LVRTERARLGLAHADAIEPNPAPALADERLIDQRRRSQDDSSQGDSEQRTEDHCEARDAPTQGDREAQHGEAQHRQAQHGETDHREAWRPQDDGSPQDRQAIDGEAHDAPQLRDTQEAPLSQDRAEEGGHAGGVPSLVALSAAHAGLSPVICLLASPAQLSTGLLLLLSFAAHSSPIYAGKYPRVPLRSPR